MSVFPAGCMIGRAVYQDPGLLHDCDERFYGKPANWKTWNDVLEEYFSYAAELPDAKNNVLNMCVKPLHNIFSYQLRNREYKQKLNAAIIEETKRVKARSKDHVVFCAGDGRVLEGLVRTALEDTIKGEILETPIRNTRPTGSYHESVVRR